MRIDYTVEAFDPDEPGLMPPEDHHDQGGHLEFDDEADR